MLERGLILVVDDSPPDALLLSKSLERSGHRVLVAHNGLDAIARAAENTPDLILLDMSMPGMDGITTCQELKRRPETQSIPVIFVTAHADSGHIVKAFEAGGSDYVTKPIRLSEILARLSVHIRLRKAETDLLYRNQELESLATQLAETNAALAQQSRIDGLTRLLNRKAWDEAAEIEHEKAVRYGSPYCVLMLDADHFKLLNDTLGHQEGDRCLQQIAKCLHKTCRTTDIAARYGGEEFVVLATETNAEAGLKLAERIRRNIWSLALRHPKSPAGRVTVSIGVAGSGEGNLEEVLRCADTYLYRAKNGGRNLAYGRKATGQPSPGKGRPAVQNPDGAESSTPDDKRASILVVEDNRANRMVYRACLEKEGYRIIETENGEEALEALKSINPELILMDVMMPVMDGITCTKQIKDDPEKCDIPIIVVSARHDAESILAGFEAGAEEYLTKPVRTTELTARVRSMIRLSTERKDLVRSYELRAEQIWFLTVLIDACRLIGDTETVDEVLQCLSSAIGEITSARRVVVMFPNDRLTHLCPVHTTQTKGVDTDLGDADMEHSVVGHVFTTRESVVINSPQEEQHLDVVAAAGTDLGTPLLLTPIGSSTHMLGVLVIADRLSRRPFEDREVEYVELVTGIAASAIQTIQNREARDEARDQIIDALARLAEHRDNDTGRHVERVTKYSCILAEALREDSRFKNAIDDAFIRNLEHAVPLHDIGKVAIPDQILNKPGKLTLNEMAVMRKHVDIGAETLRPLIAKVPDADSLKMALDIIRAHHEWYDGTGYPQGIQGESIPLSARIVAVADVYDALTRKRVYKDAISAESAQRIIRQMSGTQFDPMIVDAFVRVAEKIRALTAKLSDEGERAMQPLPTAAGTPAP